MTKATAGRKATPSKQELLKRAAQEQGQQRTEEVHDKVRAAMRTIEAEIATNEGIYPGNKGSLSMNELTRRASIHNTTLHGDKYGDLLKEAKAWLKGIKSGATIGRLRVRKTLAKRVSEWRELYEGLRQSERDTNLALQQREAELEAANAELESLRGQVEQLKSQLDAKTGKVVPLPGPNRRR